MLLIKLSSIKNEENVITYSNHLIKKNIKYTQFKQFFIYCTHNEIKGSPKISVKVWKGSMFEAEIWKTVSW